MKTDSNSLQFGEFKIKVRPDGRIVVPDLAEGLIPSLQSIGADQHLWEKSDCIVEEPKLKRNRNLLPELIDITSELVKNCGLCERRCSAKRLYGEVGFCGLDKNLCCFAYAPLYNEGPIIGSPTFGVFLSGCGLRCRTCYRKESWNPTNTTKYEPEELASVLDRAAANGVKSWMFLGGNPDHSLLAVLKTISLASCILPVVWNTALWSSPETIDILRRIVDVWIIDIKFGNDRCAVAECGIDHYMDTVLRNIEILKDENFLIFRHGLLQGHEQCCTSQIRKRFQGKHCYLEHEIFPTFHR